MKLLLLLGCWLLASATLAQAPAGSVRGHIQTSTGANLPGISVGLEGTGLGLGGGGNFSGRKVIEGPQDLRLPGYVRYEAAVSYAYGGATLALNAYNLANTRNFSGGYSQGVLYVQPPRSFRLQLSYRWQ